MFDFYVYSQALAETILLKEGQGLPIVIIRPSIVTGAWKEPMPGRILFHCLPFSIFAYFM